MLENDFWVKTEEIDYTYDVFNNLIGRQQTTYQSDGVTPATSVTQRNVFDGTNMVLTFDGNGNLTDRYLWGPMVDQVLADEQLKPSGNGQNQLPSSAGNTLWSLGDNENSVRDVVNDSGVLQEHIAYSPFGQQVAAQSTNPGSVVFVIGYTGTYTDVATADQLHGVRWYDPASQRWLSEDPIGFAGGDANLYRYACNNPVIDVDPLGSYTSLGWGNFQVVSLSVWAGSPETALIVAVLAHNKHYGTKTVEWAIRQGEAITISTCSAPPTIRAYWSVDLKHNNAQVSAKILIAQVKYGFQNAYLLMHESIHLWISEKAAAMAQTAIRRLTGHGEGATEKEATLQAENDFRAKADGMFAKAQGVANTVNITYD